MYTSYPILLVEDNPTSQKMLEKILVKEGFAVTVAENGKEALALFRERFFSDCSDRLADAGNGRS